MFAEKKKKDHKDPTEAELKIFNKKTKNLILKFFLRYFERKVEDDDFME